MNNEENTEYDGIIFFEKNTNAFMGFFNHLDTHEKGEKLESTSMGDMWHIMFYKKNKEERVSFEESFDAILIDPEIYIENLMKIDSNNMGFVLRKTKNSSEWLKTFDGIDYFEGVLHEYKKIEH